MADEKAKAVVRLSSQNNSPTSHHTQLSLSDKKEFNRCILTARELEKNGKLFEALNLYKKALLIRKYDPAISKKIAKLEAQYRMTVSEANEPEKDEQDDEQETMASNEQEKSQNTTDGEATTSKRSTRQSGQRNFYDIKDIKPYASTMVKGEPRVISQIPPFEIGAVSGDIYLGELAIPRAIADRLYDFQRDGLRWMWSLHSSQPSGGILADDMGLGKTFQIVAFVSSLFYTELVQRVLLIVPVGLIDNWKSEFARNIPQLPVFVYHGNKKTRQKALCLFCKTGGVCITTYQLSAAIADNIAELGQTEDESIKKIIETQTDSQPSDNFSLQSLFWDYTIIDEAHTIKNHDNKLSQDVRRAGGRKRLALTGTPITNNLQELWSLLDFSCCGMLLGSYHSFRDSFEIPICRGLERDASDFTANLGAELAAQLRKIIAPHFMRREKLHVVFSHASFENSSPSASVLSTPKKDEKALQCKKTDLVVWISLDKTQADLCERFSQRVIERNMRDPLRAISIAKKLANHPLLVKNELLTLESEKSRLKHKNEKAKEDKSGKSKDDLSELSPEEQQKKEESLNYTEFAAKLVEDAIKNVKDEDPFFALSAKARFTVALCRALHAGGHRTLVFSQSLAVLDLIEKALGSTLRIDGSTPIEERSKRCALFESDPTIPYFLLTTPSGGVGLNLIAADRVIIVDPSWSITDDQAADRAYRIGQTRDVEVYRLISCGTIEEKVYRLQVFKGGLMRSVGTDSETTNNDSTERDQQKDALEFDASTKSSSVPRYFSRRDIAELFKEGNHSQSETAMAFVNAGICSNDNPSVSLPNDSVEIGGVTDHSAVLAAPGEERKRSEEEIERIVREAEERIRTTRESEKPQKVRRRRRVVDDDDGNEENDADNDDSNNDNESSMGHSEKENVVEVVGKDGKLHKVIVLSDDESSESGDEIKDNSYDSRESEDVEEVAKDSFVVSDNENEEDVSDDEMSVLSEEHKNVPRLTKMGTSLSEKAAQTTDCCERHRIALPFPCVRCRCKLAPDETTMYNALLEKAFAIAERHGKTKEDLASCDYSFLSREEMEDMVLLLTKAIKICDDDISLHTHVVSLYRVLGIMP